MKKQKQELYEELQLLDKKIKQIQKHIESLDQQIVELTNVLESINEFSKLKTGVEMKVPIANGIFVSAVLKEVKNLIVNVGSNILVTKTVPQVTKMLEKQEKELKEYKQNLFVQFQTMVNRVEEIQKEFKKEEE